MKQLTKLVSTFGLASTIAMTSAHGQFSTVSVDELGGGIYNGAPVASGFLPDPFNGGAPGFAYTLPFIYTFASPAADILIYEPNNTGNLVPSDLLRFTRDPNGPNTLLFFYSDASSSDPADAPADVLQMPSPTFLYTSGVEIGLFSNPYTEAGPNGFVYNTVGGPGWDGNPAGTQYTFISEGQVPEPGSCFLLSGGLGILYGANLRRRKAISQTVSQVSKTMN